MNKDIEILYQNEGFRDSIGTVREDGKRKWIYPRKVKGKFFAWRTYLSYLLLAVLFAGPFIKIDGQPFLLLNVFERKFVIFGAVFWPQDTYLLVFLLLILMIFIILFTVVFGRVFCGWICPQTLFMEMVFRKIEYWIEGDANQQRKLDAMSWNREKVLKKSAKMGLFIIISLVIAHTVMAYLIGIEKTMEIVSRSPAENMAGFVGLMTFAGLFLFVFSWFREQVCVVVCPYGRLQGVLLDDKSINVSYDYVRGEPRGKIKKTASAEMVEPPKGDCIDCTLCVQVCPTGIDIRHGVQMECVNCTACMDACDDVMIRVNRPTGLIRYDSETGIRERRKNTVTTRMVIYSVILAALFGAFVSVLMSRSDLEATVTRFRGMTYQEREADKVSNLYEVSFINKTFEDQHVELETENKDYEIEVVGHENWLLQGQARFEGRFFIVTHQENILTQQADIELLLLQNGKVIDKITTSFVGPVNR